MKSNNPFTTRQFSSCFAYVFHFAAWTHFNRALVADWPDVSAIQVNAVLVGARRVSLKNTRRALDKSQGRLTRLLNAWKARMA